ncbi:MAG: DUF3341 domain-containing protein, partial [Flavobacteriales bacterium]|nr:DUF3341 domain-containing protein [Flavobacteriales bacterium]
VIYAVYDYPEVLKGAVRKLVTSGGKVSDVLQSDSRGRSRHPIIGITRTRSARIVLMFGITGTSLALRGFWKKKITRLISDWPQMNIGGKPNWTLYHNSKVSGASRSG